MAYLCLRKRESMKATGMQFVLFRCKRAQGPSWWALTFERKNPTSRVTVFMDGTLAAFPLTWEVFFLGRGGWTIVGTCNVRGFERRFFSRYCGNRCFFFGESCLVLDTFLLRLVSGFFLRFSLGFLFGFGVYTSIILGSTPIGVKSHTAGSFILRLSRSSIMSKASSS